MFPAEISAEDESFDLKAHLGTLRRRWKVIAICAVVAVAGSLLWSLRQESMYRAEAETWSARATAPRSFATRPWSMPAMPPAG